MSKHYRQHWGLKTINKKGKSMSYESVGLGRTVWKSVKRVLNIATNAYVLALLFGLMIGWAV